MNSFPDEEFYDRYCQYTLDAAAKIAYAFDDEEIRQQILETEVPMSREQLLEALQQMENDPVKRSRFIRRINMGFEISALMEPGGGIIFAVRNSIKKRFEDDNSGENRFDSSPK